jgi:conjugative transposon TraN protein
MKRLCAVWILFFSLAGRAQRSIPSYSISVTFKKTTNIIFPYQIEKADVGSSDVIGHKDEKLKNVLFLKASRKDFAPTNLSVYTSDGKFYSFIVIYKEDPDTLNLSFISDQQNATGVIDTFMSAKLDTDAIQILAQPSFMHRKFKSEDMKAILNGIYLMDDLLWFRITIKNHSAIIYKPAFTQFSIRDKKVGKRTAVQESALAFSWSAVKPILGNSREIYVFAIPSFTIAGEKKLVFQMEEKNGERTILLDIPSAKVLKSRTIQ